MDLADELASVHFPDGSDGPYPAGWRAKLIAAFWRDPTEAQWFVWDFSERYEEWLQSKWRDGGCYEYSAEPDDEVAHYFWETVDPSARWADPYRVLEELVARHPRYARAIVGFLHRHGAHLDARVLQRVIREARGREGTPSRLRHSPPVHRRGPRARGAGRPAGRSRAGAASSGDDPDLGESEPPAPTGGGR